MCVYELKTHKKSFYDCLFGYILSVMIHCGKSLQKLIVPTDKILYICVALNIKLDNRLLLYNSEDNVLGVVLKLVCRYHSKEIRIEINET